MKSLFRFSILAACLAAAPAGAAGETGRVDFNRDIRPILADNCFACHGFDSKTRMGELRLDIPETAVKAGKSGKLAIVPGKPGESEVVRRIEATNGLKMPPESTKKKLSAEQVALLKRWIDEGAKYAGHWAFEKPVRPVIPAVKNRWWPINDVDRFVLARLEKEGLKPSPAADRRTLIRRVTLDLTGLPPTTAEVEAFVGDKAPGAYERVVDRLLASPRYGERMGLFWLDLARYADTHGFHIDSHRDMWPWRDWVIQAFNSNLPYNQFVTEQLAGDLLPNPTLQQKIATGFNRNHPINFEGGAIPEEYLNAYVSDRVDTTSTVFMGLTLKCAQCHDHKYDPLTAKDFYRFYAFFNNNKEAGLDGQDGNARPFIKVATPEQRKTLDTWSARIAELEKGLKERAGQVAAAQAAWEQSAASGQTSGVSDGLVLHLGLDEGTGSEAAPTAGSVRAALQKTEWAEGKVGKALKTQEGSEADLGKSLAFDRTDAFSYGAWIYPGSRDPMAILSRMDDANKVRGWDLYYLDGKVFVHLIHEWDRSVIRVNTKDPVSNNKWHHVFATYDGSGKAAGVRVYVDGKPASLDVTHDTLNGTILADQPVRIGRRSTSAYFRGRIDEVRIYNRALSPLEVEQLATFDEIRPVLAQAADKRTAAQKEAVTRYFLVSQDAPYQEMTAELAEVKRKHSALDNSIPTTMVMEEMEKPRDTHILIRGAYDRPGEKVTPGVPEVLGTLPEGAPANRLSLAKWLVDPSHPLTSRVAVNRFWQILFGNGIVKSSENFGTQGDRPTHPELLDWLALEFVEGPGDAQPWDMKALLRLIVTSATYRQSSRATPELLERDAENLLLARGPRFRLPGEFVRDQALAVSGLLVDTIGGPSVKPYHPEGLWEEIAFGARFTAQTYEQDHGDALYRRGMYTFWKRTCPPPSMQTFDAPEREFCVVRRSVTNTPLQALVLMNDPSFVEASRKLAERVLTEVAATPKDRIVYAYRLVLGRMPRSEEIREVLALYQDELAIFKKDPEAAKKLLSVGESKRNEKLDVAEHAAWSAVASVLFNLDEVITKN